MTQHRPIMTPVSGPADLTLSWSVLDQLMPLHIHLSSGGIVTHLGPTLRGILGNCIGQPFFHLFRVTRPAGLDHPDDLLRRGGEKLSLTLLNGASGAFRGQALPDQAGGVLLNLSFGIGVLDAVRRHALTVSDFAVTDLAVEMLYLVEAKTAVHDEFRRLSLRLEGARSDAEEKAMTDTLTGLRNRRAFDHALARACEARMDFALMHLDLDKFKAVNDTMGHAAGDHVLREVGLALREETRASDTVARVGGDEFVLLLPGMTEERTLMQLSDRLIRRLSVPIPYEGTVCQIGASIGIVTTVASASPLPEPLLEAADQALYAAKRAGRGCARMAGAEG